MSARIYLIAIICVMLTLQNVCLSQNEPATQVFGPRGIMDTSPIIEVPIVEEEPIDLEAMSKIPLAERLAKYDFMLGDLPRAGTHTPYFRGQLIGNFNDWSGGNPHFIPFIWLEPENNRGKRITLQDAQSSHRRYDELELTGNSSDTSAWRTRTIPVSPGTLYRFSVFATSSRNGGELTAGTDFAKNRWQNIASLPARGPRDWREPSPPRRSFLLFTPENKDRLQIQVGPGRSGFTYRISRVHIEPVLPIYRGIQSSVPLDVNVIAGTSSFIGLPGGEPKNADNRGGDFLRLGDGERIEEGKYHFRGTFGNNGVFHRPIHSTTATFDTDRIVFANQGDELIYRFELQPIRIDDKPGHFVPPAIGIGKGSVKFDMLNTQDARITLDWSIDGVQWQGSMLMGTTRASGRQVGMESIFDAKNAETLFIRLRNTGTGSFAVTEVSLEAEIDSTEYIGEGKTVFAVLQPLGNFDRQAVEGTKMVPLMFAADNALYKLFINETETEQGFGGGYMDYGGTEDDIGVHGDGPGKWTIMTFGNHWGAVRPYRARIDVWAYNWFGDANFFCFHRIKWRVQTHEI